jgi:hypothetical protein
VEAAAMAAVGSTMPAAAMAAVGSTMPASATAAALAAAAAA